MGSLLGLIPNNILILNGINYELLGIAGEGGSSIAYKARDASKVGDYYIIKEFFPHNLNIGRNSDGTVNVTETSKEEFNELKERVIREFQIANVLRHDHDSQSNREWIWSYSEPAEQNNTLYTVIATGKGDMLSSKINSDFFKEKDFTFICECILKILDALEPIHGNEYLHLDVSPDNIHFSDLGIARLIDFNSALHTVGDNSQNWIPSFKKGYSARELTHYTATKHFEITPATDLYSVVAIFFELLVGRTPGDGDWRKRSRWELNNKTGVLAGTSNLLVKEVNDFLWKGLSLRATNRFQNTSEIRKTLQHLISLKADYELVNNPKYPNEYFVCRESELEQISNALNEKNYVILEGMRGIGKTELVKKYAEKYNPDYDIVQFITFDGSSLETTIANRLNFENFDHECYRQAFGDKAVEMMYNEKIKRLKNEKYNKRTLIIIDNFDIATPSTEKHIASFDKKFSELTSGNYKIIFTSRERHEGKHALLIKSMESKTDLRRLFSSYYGDETETFITEDETVIDEIVELVLGHTMTIMLIAATIKRGRFTPHKMLERLQKGLDPKLLTKINIDKEGLDDEERYNIMYKHIQTLFDMTEIHANENYAFIMTNMAIVPYTGLKFEEFYSWALADHYKSDEYEDEVYNDNDLNELIDRRWVRLENGCVSLHPVISDIANRELKPDSVKCEELVTSIVKYVIRKTNKTFIEHNEALDFMQLPCKRIIDKTVLTAFLYYSSADVYQKLAKYDESLKYHFEALKIFQKVREGEFHADIAMSYKDIGMVYHDFGKYSEALEYLFKALEIRLRNNDDESVATLYHVIGNAYQSLGKHEKALENYNKAFEIEKRLYNEEAEYVASYNNIGMVHYALSEYGKALEYLGKALRIRQETQRENDSNIATSYNNVGMVYNALDRHDEALDCYNKALEIDLSIYGEIHSETAMSYHMIGTVYCELGKYNEALEHYNKALELKLKVYGKESHPSVAITYNNLGELYKKMDRLGEALKYYRKALEVLQDVYGEELHPDKASSYYGIAGVCHTIGKHEMALDSYNRALEIELKIHGEKPRQKIAALYHNMAETYNVMDKPMEALEYLNKALEIYPIIYDNEPHPNIAMSHDSVGYTYHAAFGKHNEALKHFNISLDIRLRFHKREPHPDIAMSYTDIGNAYYALNEYNEALEYYGKSLDVHLKFSGEESQENIGLAHDNISMVYLALGEYDKALNHLQIFLEMVREVGQVESTIALLENEMGAIYSSLGEYRNALMSYKNALEIWTRTDGTDAPTTAMSYKLIGWLYADLDEYDKTLEHFNKLLAIRLEAHKDKPHQDIAESYHDIGGLYYDLSKYDEARDYFNKSATMYNSAAIIYDDQGDYVTALELYHKSREIYERIFGKDHPDVATTYNNLALVYDRYSKYAMALEWILKAKEIYEKTLGINDPSTANAYNTMALIYSHQYNDDAALEWFHKAKEIYENALETDHQDIAKIYNNIAEAYRNKGENANVLNWLQKAREIYEKEFGVEHPKTANVYNNIAGAYSDNGEYDKALELHQKARRIREKILGKNHPDTANSYCNIASVYSSLKEYDKALELYQIAGGIIGSVLGFDHPFAVMIFNGMANVYFRQKEYDKALELYINSLRICLSTMGKEHPTTKDALNYLHYVYAEVFGDEANFGEWLRNQLDNQT